MISASVKLSLINSLSRALGAALVVIGALSLFSILLGQVPVSPDGLLLWAQAFPMAAGFLLLAGHWWVHGLVNQQRTPDLALYERILLLGQVIQLGFLLVLYALTQGALPVLLCMGFPGLVTHWLGSAKWARWMNVAALLVVALWLPFGYPTVLASQGGWLLAQVLPVMLLYAYGLRIMSQLHTQSEGQVNELSTIATTDTLTTLMNRRYFNQRLSEEMSRARRYHEAFSLVLVDIDDFKRVNDTYGHSDGDTLLRELALLLKTNMRESDVLARFGGEELVLILPNTSRLDAYELLERLRQLTASHTFRLSQSQQVQATVSIGVAQYDERDVSSIELIREADAALYEAKRRGKNQVIVYGQHRPLGPDELQRLADGREPHTPLVTAAPTAAEADTEAVTEHVSS